MSEEKEKTVESIIEQTERRLDAYERWADDNRPGVVESARENGQSCVIHSLLLEVDVEDSLQKSYARADESFALAYKPCPECLLSKRQDMEKRRWMQLGIPARVATATVKGYFCKAGEEQGEEQRRFKEAIVQWASEESRPTFLLLFGTPGTGKSHMAAALMKHFHESGQVAGWTRWSDLVRTHRKGYDDPKHTGKALEIAKNQPFMVIDDVIPCKGADEYEIWTEIIEKRHDNQSPTVITTNEEESVFFDNCIAHVGAVDRLKSDSLIRICKWKSYR